MVHQSPTCFLRGMPSVPPFVRRFIVVIAAVVLPGCGDEGPPNPVPVPSASGSTGTGGAPPLPVFKRSVSQRNPMGGRPGNLLVDGDFEHSIIREGSGAQIGWLALGGSGGQTYLRGETGGLCRTGLRCAVLLPGQSFYGKGTAAQDTGMIAEVWAKPPAESDCNDVSPIVFPCNFSNSFQIKLLPVDAEPDADGWCQYQASTSPSSNRFCMWIDGTIPTDEHALIDSATLLPNDGTAPVRAPEPMPPERRERVAAAVRWIRDRMPFGRPPSSGPKLGVR